METKVQRLLLQLDGDRHPSVFDAVVAYDAGEDVLLFADEPYHVTAELFPY